VTYLLLLGGFLLLVGGAEALVTGASRLAARVGLSPLVIGLTVVAFGTSAPELAVSIGSALGGQADVALGNVVGSNIFNVLLILGLSALIAPLAVSRQLVRLDVPVMVGVSGLVFALALDGQVGRLDGLLLAGGLLAYTTAQIVQGRRASSDAPDAATGASAPPAPPASAPASGLPLWAAGLLVVGGLGLLVLGARWLVDGAVTLATALGASELVIGLTIIAGGTSLPELATSMLASWRGQREIAVGNVVGSNVFNLLGVLGLSGAVAPAGIAVSPGALWFDLPVMGAVALACLPIFFTGQQISRWEGVLFVGYYGAYVTYLILTATRHPSLPAWELALGAFALPLTALVLLAAAVRAWRRPERPAP
jgi:cation:H+ antiporter